jgi:CheY-like chemotaxis protein
MTSSLADTERDVGPRPDTFTPQYSVAQEDDDSSLQENLRVMIVDDDPFFRSLLKVMLQQAGLPNPEILEAEDSNTAVSICLSKPIDLIFCDLHLPVFRSKNGLEIIRELRQINPVVPVYMVTAENSEALIRRVCAVGATGHILKPVSLRILKRVILSLKVDPEVN